MKRSPSGVKDRKADLGEDREMQIALRCWQPGKTGVSNTTQMVECRKKQSISTAPVSVGGGEITSRNSKIPTFLPESRQNQLHSDIYLQVAKRESTYASSFPEFLLPIPMHRSNLVERKNPGIRFLCIFLPVQFCKW